MRRVARCFPRLSHIAIAQRVGCHPSTAARHLASAGGRTAVTRAAAEAVARSGQRDRVIPADHPSAAVLIDAEMLRSARRTDVDRSPAEMHEIAGHHDSNVRREVAAHEDSPPRVLARLTADPVDFVRRFAAQHARNPRLVVSARDAEPAVRAATALLSCDATVPLLPRLSLDRAVVVRNSVARNKRCPPAVLELLAKDADMGVVTEVAMNPASPPAAITWLARSGDPSRRQAAAGHHRCPRRVMERLAGDDSWGVRLHVANNPSCPAELLKRLASDIDPQVSKTALNHANYDA